MHLGDRGGARSAYKSAVEAYRGASKLDPSNSNLVIKRVYVLVLLGRAEEARSVFEKARAGNPGDRVLRNFQENRGLDKMLSDPGLKSVTP